ncbi:MAG: hypothetical protein IKS55_01080 [Oscillospiraceae bacterium]|nr:hypothetical protein [Oscillospiraceae bacterium]
MKHICNYKASKYLSPAFTEVEPDIYKSESGFVTSLCFEQEPELNEGSSADCISQYPLEDVLDHFFVHISDFYHNLNTCESEQCYLEFCGKSLKSVKDLRTIIGKHVYNKTVMDSGTEYIDLVIE